MKSYHALCEQKDAKHRELENRFLKVQAEYARLQRQVAQRQQDIEYRIEAERRNFEVGLSIPAPAEEHRVQQDRGGAEELRGRPAPFPRRNIEYRIEAERRNFEVGDRGGHRVQDRGGAEELRCRRSSSTGSRRSGGTSR